MDEIIQAKLKQDAAKIETTPRKVALPEPAKEETLEKSTRSCKSKTEKESNTEIESFNPIHNSGRRFG